MYSRYLDFIYNKDRSNPVRCVKIGKPCYKNHNSIVDTFRVLGIDYVQHNRQTELSIGKIVKKIKETGCVTDMLRHTRHRNAIERQGYMYG